MELTILMPCLNEVRTVGLCVQKACRFLEENGVEGEVLVADNGSTDGSVELARSQGARVIHVHRRGYGAALAAGIEAAHGRYVIMADSDDSYDVYHLGPFLEKLRDGYDLVMGNRFRGGIAPGAMPVSHRYFGNPLITAVGRLLFRRREVGDFYCGLRGFRKASIQKLRLQSSGMEFALEMVVKSGLQGLRTVEVPTTLVPDGRDRPPHLRSYRDGWRSLRYYLLMSPRWFFAVPGAALLLVGGLACGTLFSGPVVLGRFTFDYHTLLYGLAAVVLGYQSLILAAFTKLLAVETSLHPLKTKLWSFTRRSTLEQMVLLGCALIALGVCLGFVAWSSWSVVGYQHLEPTKTIRWVAGSLLFLLVGAQTIQAGFCFGVINILHERRLHESTSLSPAYEEIEN